MHLLRRPTQLLGVPDDPSSEHHSEQTTELSVGPTPFGPQGHVAMHTGRGLPSRSYAKGRILSPGVNSLGVHSAGLGGEGPGRHRDGRRGGRAFAFGIGTGRGGSLRTGVGGVGQRLGSAPSTVEGAAGT